MNLFRFLRGPMPLMGVGLALVVLSGAGFIGLIARSEVDGSGVAALSSLYFLVNTIALGVFSGVEQEMSRSVSQERALGRPAAPVAHFVARQGARLLVPATVVLLAISPVLVAGPLQGRWELVALLFVSLVSAWAAASVRGALAGSQRFGFYSATLAAEGLSRLVPCVVLWLAGTGSAWVFGLVFVLGQFFAALLGVVLLWLSGQRDWRAPSPAVAPRIEGAGTMRFGVSSALALVVVANLTNQAIVNLPPVMLAWRPEASTLLVTVIAGAVTLTRLPMFAFVPLQTMLLPRLTSGAAQGDLLGVRRQTLKTVAACVVLGVLGIVVLGTAGQWLLGLYLGPGVDLAAVNLSAAALAGLGVGTLFLMTSNVTQPALLALGRHRMVLVSYLTGAAAMVLAFLLPVEPITSAVLTTSAGPVALVLVMAVVLVRVTGRAQPPAAGAPTLVEPRERTTR
ncbi:hypothetical protein ACSHWB_14610 [Lentzea sp. HUAS TT2]|uniref:hypothetical protein n=1 Tax=Lentzea sp. HUAS TT2 TaxID=3447454 RepID=UPI003F721455